MGLAVMGLACSHNAWRGTYSAFMRWRKMLADVAGLPPLELMEGFFVPLSDERGLPTLYHGMNTREPAFGPGSDPHMAKLDNYLPIRWDCLKPSALHELLYHSDYDGEIAPVRCGPIADALEELIPKLPDGEGVGHIGNWRQTTQRFVDGLRAAAAAGEPLRFY